MNKTILVVEDQQDIGDLIRVNLEPLNFDVTHCTDGNSGLQQAQTASFDAIILDIMLPGINGLEICQKLRQQNIHTPILMLTAKKTEIDRVVGLEVGADDYLTKPFSIRELQARLHALLRRVAFHQQDAHTQHLGSHNPTGIADSQNAENQSSINQSSINQTTELQNQNTDDTEDQLRFDHLSINIQKRKLDVDGKNINLTAKEFDLVLYLASHPGQVFTREQILNAVWGYQHDSYEHTVNSHINRVRAKIETDPAKPKFLLTVWGVGYKFFD